MYNNYWISIPYAIIYLYNLNKHNYGTIILASGSTTQGYHDMKFFMSYFYVYAMENMSQHVISHDINSVLLTVLILVSQH